MIATLSGVVSEKLGDVLVLDVGGVGYGLIVTLADFGSLHAGQPAKLYVHEHIREDAHDLYGFAQQDTLGLFRQLLSVKNVGPKVALAVLGIGTAADVRAAIAGGDVKRLQTAKGVGKRAAEQMVVELRDKVAAPAGDPGVALPGTAAGVGAQVTQALVGLGFTENAAAQAVSKVLAGQPDADSQTALRAALAGLGPRR
ncbi:Holliday junction branch migration protein RuvA [Candidatus Saccharibacteria bacterium]|nr:Holliday junction branch migration protein RuvA [Candidatus Saccharibacteria bacterium]